MNYFNVGKIVNTQGLQGEMRVLSVTDFAEERFKKGNTLALFDKKDQFVMDVEIASHRKVKNFDIIKFKGMYHINDIEKFRDFTLKVREEDLTANFTTMKSSVLKSMKMTFFLVQLRKFCSQAPMMFGLSNAKASVICCYPTFRQWCWESTLSKVGLM